MASSLDRVRAICLAFPGVTERLSHGAPTWFVRRSFVTYWVDGHHDLEFPHLWCAAPVGAQAELVAADPERFFRPPYVGGRGWVGVRMDGRVDWTEVGELCEDAYRTVAPVRLVQELAPREYPRHPKP
ncbi:MAG TPA: MmcQ/YjbR family DNA-binding protein [Micromonosporaceae bacterium]|nr:MmcQ/YjbR family DNA-binding protein [Micromonosporaceae bacterium]